MSIQAIIFDCFGVLAREGIFPFLDKYFADNDEKRQLAVATMKRMGAGIIGHDDCIAELAELADISFADMERILKDNPPDDQLFDFIEHTLKSNCRVAMLSNAGADRTVELFGEHRASLFDSIVLSYQVGMVKPDAAIYRIAAERLGVLPEECIFVDDVERYCDAARDVGMQAIWHKNTPQTITKIEELLRA